MKHILLVNKRLFGFLMGPVLAHSRYDFRLHLDKHQRYEIKRAALSRPDFPFISRVPYKPL